MYSNGFDITKVLGALTGRVGWRQPTTSGFFTLDSANLTANSGRCFEDFHAIVRPGNILAVQEDEAIDEGGFNAYLQSMQKGVIMKCLNAVFNKRDILEKKLLFERYGRQDYVEPNAGRFVGVQIVPPKDYRKTVQLDSVALMFDSDVTFNLYLFHDAILAPVATLPVTATAKTQTVVTFPTPVYLNHSDTHKGGAFYLGYFQDDLAGVQAINEMVREFNCFYNFGMMPVELNRIPAQLNFDRNQVSYTVKTHGLNVQLSCFRDHTQLILENPYVFDALIGLQMAADVIELIQNSTRTNKDQRVTESQSAKLYTDLNLAMSTQDMPYSTGLKNQIQRELHRVRKELFPPHKIETNTHDTESRSIYGVPGIDQVNY